MVSPSGEQIEIALGDQRAVVVEVGGGLRAYSAAGRDMLDGYGADEMCPSGPRAGADPVAEPAGGRQLRVRGRAAPAHARRTGQRQRDPRPRPLGWMDGRRARAAPSGHGAPAPPPARLSVLARPRDRVPAVRGGPRGADHGHERRLAGVPIRDRRPSISVGRHADGGLGCPARRRRERSCRRTSAASRSARSRSRGRTTTSGGRDRSARPAWTTASPISSATATGSRA